MFQAKQDTMINYLANLLCLNISNSSKAVMREIWKDNTEKGA